MTIKRERKTYRSEARTAAAGETRERIIDAARSLLAGGEKHPAFSLEAVARVAGVTRLTVYNAFESKRGLLEAVFDHTAREGGLHELPSVFAESDTAQALRRVVSVFCRFWASHGKVFPRLMAVARLDADIAESVAQRTERRRQLLTVLVGRIPSGQELSDLVDILFALTSYDMYHSLSNRRRSGKAIEALIQELVHDALSRRSDIAALGQPPAASDGSP